MSKPYSQRLRNKAKLIALENNIDVKEGVYVGVSGPTFETPAEYKMFRILGGDIVGMSTVPEVIVARHMDMRVFGISIVTDSGVPGEIVEISHEEVQEVAMKAEPKMTLIMRDLIKSI
jgi:purine-nucleoside phosphorylase